jgi:hypothetical protein
MVNRRGRVWEIYKTCLRWVESLPNGTRLVEVTTTVPPDADLAEVRSRKAEVQDDLHALHTAPALADDIRARVEAYVAGLSSAVQIRGIGPDPTLVITTKDATGWDRDLTPLQIEALMRPDELVAAFMARIESMADTPVPPAERPAAIAELERELEQLQRTEEALITAAEGRGEEVTRSHDVPPWVLLGVAVAEKPQKRAATDSPAPHLAAADHPALSGQYQGASLRAWPATPQGRWVHGQNGSLRFRTTAPIKAIQRLTLANLRPRRHWATKRIWPSGKPR